MACGTDDSSEDQSMARGTAERNIQLWTDGVVSFVITDDMDSDDEQVARKAMKDIEASTCIRFKERTDEKYYVRMSRVCNPITGVCTDETAAASKCRNRKKGCFPGGWVSGGSMGESSPSELFIGKVEMKVTSQRSVRLFIHEILHSLGVHHTQRRHDRDQFIKILGKAS